MPTPSPAAFASSLPANSRIGRFSIIRELGRGTAGCVYLAHDPVIDRDVAIKTFNPRLSLAEKARFEQHFINEARAAGRLSHPHIVTIHEASSEGGVTYLAMEYIEGKELHRALANGRRFSADETATIAWKLASALHHAHQRGVIHRDIKPSNIFLADEDQPKLIDFGIARAPNRLADRLSPQYEPYTMVRDNQLLGTPHYMSPEQSAGKPVDHRTDIYSLGTVMFELLTGRTPFQSERTDKLLQQIIYKAAPSPRDIDSRVPEGLAVIVEKAMHKRPEKRYHDAGEMALDIKRYLLKEKRARQRSREPLVLDEAPSDQGISAHGVRMRGMAIAVAAIAAVCMMTAAGLLLLR
ncbi:serine/threonine-protein kinase [Noviherbaspirillum sp. CPCC 100848]|uniref:Serine/threonine-protein kinase n=1 Tax=Noviherbaspirillum album TaxID=3080276 RepID=A0ABU6JEN8_9BURK|nr:serine/threonine-protein kinase [Noviherbaspirillum sp. CPCC 100848]MEC4722135.1 serine/threonine-protein kinase [Noviherbaspirillum sp. CPCC 100848]